MKNICPSPTPTSIRKIATKKEGNGEHFAPSVSLKVADGTVGPCRHLFAFQCNNGDSI